MSITLVQNEMIKGNLSNLNNVDKAINLSKEFPPVGGIRLPDGVHNAVITNEDDFFAVMPIVSKRSGKGMSLCFLACSVDGINFDLETSNRLIVPFPVLKGLKPSDTVAITVADGYVQSVVVSTSNDGTLADDAAQVTDSKAAKQPA